MKQNNFDINKNKTMTLIFFIIFIFSNTSILFSGTISSQPESGINKFPKILLELPKYFNLEDSYEIITKYYHISLKTYSYDPADGLGSFSLSIEELSDHRPRYYEFGFPPPVKKNPMAIFEQKKGPTLLIIKTVLDTDNNRYILRCYDIDEPYNQTTLRLGGSSFENINDFVGDFDGDGHIEVRNLELKVAGTKQNMGQGADWGVLSIYRYIPGGGTFGKYYSSPNPHFERVKGRAFEKYFMQHAEKLINKDYPEYLRRIKTNSSDIPKIEKTDLEAIVLNWLATVESTENPVLIKNALNHLKILPFPDKKRKEDYIKMLIQNGYPLLQQKQLQ